MRPASGLAWGLLRARLRGLSTDSTQRSTWVLPIATGGGVAVPIFEPIIHAVWANVAPKTALSPPSPEAKRQLSCKSVDLESGEVQSGGKAVTECLRVDGKGRVVDTQYRLVSRSGANAKPDREASRSTKRERPNSSNDIPRTNDRWAREPWRTTPQWNSQWQYEQRWREERRQPNAYWGSWR
jgi:hypothetical protein